MLNTRHAIMKACAMMWIQFMQGAVMIAAVIYFWSIAMAPAWFLTVMIVCVVGLWFSQAYENYSKVRQDFYRI